MSEETIENRISQAIGHAEYAWVPQDVGNYNASRLMFIKHLGRAATKEAIEAFSDTLLSEPVVEAAAEAEHKRMWQGAYSPFTWAEEDTGIKDGIRDSTRETLKAALAAITTPAGDGTG